MDGNIRIAVIPAYEPGREMLVTAAQLKENGFEIVIVDDGSGESCGVIFAEAAGYCTVLHHDVNRGKGAALKTAFSFIKKNYSGPYTVVTVDADGQHRTEDAIRVCCACESNREALTLGSRRFSGKVPLRSRFGNTVTRFVFMLSSKKRIYDTQTGLRAFSDRLTDRMLSIGGDRYEYEMNMLLKLAADNVPINEVWIETVYLNGNESSHFDTIRDSYRVYKEIIRFSGSSLLCFCIDYLLYCLLFAVTGVLVFSNVAARVVSAAVNYTLNRRLVFRSSASVVKSAVKYFGLALFILLCNTLLLKMLAGMGLNGYLAKIPVELSMSLFSWLIQHKFVFVDEKGPVMTYQTPENNERRSRTAGGWTAVFAVCLTLFTTYVMLDTFVLSSIYRENATEMNLELFDEAAATTEPAESSYAAGSSGTSDSTTQSSSGSKKSRGSDSTKSHASRSRKGSTADTSGSTTTATDDADTTDADQEPQSSSGMLLADEDGATGSYSDEHINIVLKEYEYENTAVYVADVSLSSAVYLKTAFARGTYGKNVTEKTSEIAEDNDAILAINGDYYGAREDGCVIRNGVVYREAGGDADILCIYADGSFEIVSPEEADAESLVKQGVWQAFSFGPSLIEDGEITVTAGDEVGKAMASNPRTAIGVIDDLHYIFVVSDGRTDESEGLSLSELASLMKELGAETAYNLDGGGSSTMVFNGTIINNPTTTGRIKERKVSDIVYIG